MSGRRTEGCIDWAAELSFELICRSVLSGVLACYYPLPVSDARTSLTITHLLQLGRHPPSLSSVLYSTCSRFLFCLLSETLLIYTLPCPRDLVSVVVLPPRCPMGDET